MPPRLCLRILARLGQRVPRAGLRSGDHIVAPSQQDFRTFAEARLRSRGDTALLYLGELRILLDPPRVQQEFSREELEALLR